MKLNMALLFLGSVSAFAPRATIMRPASSLSMQDTSEAVKKALEASGKMGKTSPEARMAWEFVEELDAANAHEKALLKELERKQAEIEALTKQVEQQKEASGRVPAVHADTSAAVQKALEASRIHGKASVEARMAWEEVEEMDAANSHHKSDGSPTVEAPAAAASVEKPKPTTANTPSPDVEAAISNALLLSKAFGKKAPEARLAWELVEELEARDSHKRAQFRAALEKQEAERAALAAAKAEQEATPKEALHTDSAQAVKAALAASKEFGATSVEARMAWELVEEIDATNAHHKTTGSG